MTNEESFNNITSAIKATNDALDVYDSLTERCAIAQATSAALGTELDAIRANSANLDAKTRGAKFTVTNSALSLAQSDLKAAEDSFLAQKALAASIGRATGAVLIQARDQLQNHRLAKVSEQLSADFAWNAIYNVTPQDVATAHKSVRSLKDLGVSQLRYELEHDDGFVIGAARQLDKHWQELKPLIESEGVDLLIAAVQVPTVAKPKVVSASNVLGTLSQTQAIAA